MELSTYSILGAPDPLATALVLVSISLTLAPWLCGTELGPLKVPKLPSPTGRWLRIGAPIWLIVFTIAFVKVWPEKNQDSQPLSYKQYLDGFFDTSKNQAIRGTSYPMNELESRELQQALGSTKWDGGANRGEITFNEFGRQAAFTNQAGRSPGTLLLQGVPMGSVPLIVGEWQQQDGQSGRIMLSFSLGSNWEQLEVNWGSAFVARSTWKRVR